MQHYEQHIIFSPSRSDTSIF